MQKLTKRLSMWATGIALLLLVPFIAMQFNTEVNWTAFDFIFMGALLFSSAFAYELIARNMRNGSYRLAVGIAVLASLLLVWINGAVGIIGSEDNPANLMYLGVIAVGIFGSILARFKPTGLLWTSTSMTIAQALIPVIALLIFRPAISETPGVVGVFMINTFFVMAFAASALLFRNASTENS